MPRPNDVGVGTAIVILNDQLQILLGKRKGAHQAGVWACPGGWLDRSDKRTEEAVIREALEETGLIIGDVGGFMWTTEDHPDFRTVTLYHITDDFQGEPKVMEPEKCEEWRWFDLDQLPDSLFPGMQDVIAELKEYLSGVE